MRISEASMTQQAWTVMNSSKLGQGQVVQADSVSTPLVRPSGASLLEPERKVEELGSSKLTMKTSSKSLTISSQ